MRVFQILKRPRPSLGKARIQQWSSAGLCQLAKHQKPLKVLYFGTDQFAVPSLKMLHAKRQCGQISQLEVVCVRLKSIRPAVRVYAEEHQLPIWDWPPDIFRAQFDLGVVASFGHLIPKRIIELFPYGMLNVHASLLPRWRGAAPIVHALLAGDDETGVTIMTIKPHKFDIGDIVSQRSVVVPPSADVRQLTDQLAQLGADLLAPCLDDLTGSLAAARPQLEQGVTPAPRLTPADYRVVWDSPAERLLRQSRALPQPLITGWQGRRVRLTAPLQLAEPQGAPPGAPGQLTYWRPDRHLLARCRDAWLHLPALQIQGKPSMTGTQFYNGFLSRSDPEDRRFDPS